MPEPRAVFAASIFAVVTGVIVWASVSREPLQDKSLFDVAGSRAEPGVAPATPPNDTDALLNASSSKPSSPSSSLDRTIRTLNDDVGAIGQSPTGDTANATKSADEAIARADAALAAMGIPPSNTSSQNDARSEKLTALQAKLDRLRD